MLRSLSNRAPRYRAVATTSSVVGSMCPTRSMARWVGLPCTSLPIRSGRPGASVTSVGLYWWFTASSQAADGRSSISVSRPTLRSVPTLSRRRHTPPAATKPHGWMTPEVSASWIVTSVIASLTVAQKPVSRMRTEELGCRSSPTSAPRTCSGSSASFDSLTTFPAARNGL